MKKQLLLVLIGFWSLGIQAQKSAHTLKHIEQQEKTSGKSQELEGAELLAAHELKSNETYDFKIASIEAENEFVSVSNSDDFEVSETSNEYTINSIPDPLQTIFKSDPNKKSTDKKQKTKRKKNGTGLLIAGTALYIALQLLK